MIAFIKLKNKLNLCNKFYELKRLDTEKMKMCWLKISSHTVTDACTRALTHTPMHTHARVHTYKERGEEIERETKVFDLVVVCKIGCIKFG